MLLPEDQLAIIVSDGEDGKGVKATLRFDVVERPILPGNPAA